MNVEQNYYESAAYKFVAENKTIPQKIAVNFYANEIRKILPGFQPNPHGDYSFYCGHIDLDNIPTESSIHDLGNLHQLLALKIQGTKKHIDMMRCFLWPRLSTACDNLRSRLEDKSFESINKLMIDIRLTSSTILRSTFTDIEKEILLFAIRRRTNYQNLDKDLALKSVIERLVFTLDLMDVGDWNFGHRVNHDYHKHYPVYMLAQTMKEKYKRGKSLDYNYLREDFYEFQGVMLEVPESREQIKPIADWVASMFYAFREINYHTLQPRKAGQPNYNKIFV